MAYNIDTKEKALELRAKGFSYKEISIDLHIAKSTAYFWTKDLVLSRNAQKILEPKTTLAQMKAVEYNVRRHRKVREEISRKVDRALENLPIDKTYYKVVAALLYWAEGGKAQTTSVSFTNSDPKMIRVFMHALREGFSLQEHKVRALVHIHEYHNDDEIRQFWSKVSNIPLSQFNRSYLKPHTNKRNHPGYMGCVNIRYFDSKIAAELQILYNKLSDKLGGVVQW